MVGEPGLERWSITKSEHLFLKMTKRNDLLFKSTIKHPVALEDIQCFYLNEVVWKLCLDPLNH